MAAGALFLAVVGVAFAAWMVAADVFAPSLGWTFNIGLGIALAAYCRANGVRLNRSWGNAFLLVPVACIILAVLFSSTAP